jgi:hypothetical protein
VAAIRHPWVAAATLLLGLVAGCTQSHAVPIGSGHHGSSQPPVVRPGPLPAGLRGPTSCGVPYLFWISKRWVESGSCAGLIASTPTTVSMQVGSAFVVRVEHEATGALSFPIPRPDRPIVALTGHHHYWADYRATRVGTVDLLSRTRFCAGHDPRQHTCPVLRVHVTAQ